MDSKQTSQITTPDTTPDTARFMKVYANVPLNLRREVIAVVDDKPLNWNAAYLEVSEKTQVGLLITSKLIEMGII